MIIEHLIHIVTDFSYFEKYEKATIYWINGMSRWAMKFDKLAHKIRKYFPQKT